MAEGFFYLIGVMLMKGFQILKVRVAALFLLTAFAITLFMPVRVAEASRLNAPSNSPNIVSLTAGIVEQNVSWNSGTAK
jgi:hypothetical protein